MRLLPLVLPVPYPRINVTEMRNLHKLKINKVSGRQSRFVNPVRRKVPEWTGVNERPASMSYMEPSDFSEKSKLEWKLLRIGSCTCEPSVDDGNGYCLLQ
jgi:hypothetical protein